MPEPPLLQPLQEDGDNSEYFWFGYKLMSPVDEDIEDAYWEQMIWYVNYSDCDLKKAEKTYFTNWDKKYLE